MASLYISFFFRLESCSLFCTSLRQLSCKREQMINLRTLFYSFSGLVPGPGPHSHLNKLGDDDLCCVGVETLNHLGYVTHRMRSILIMKFGEGKRKERRTQWRVGRFSDSRRDFGPREHVQEHFSDVNSFLANWLNP